MQAGSPAANTRRNDSHSAPEKNTATARQDARKMELSPGQMQHVVCALEHRMLCKSMTTYADHRVWQDVYLIKIYGTEIYIKVTYRPGGGPPVISFKEKTL